MGKTSEMDPYSGATPVTATDLVCIDREGDASYYAEVDFLAELMETNVHDARYIIADDVTHTAREQSVCNIFNIIGPTDSDAPQFFMKDTVDPTKLFAMGLFGSILYAWTTTQMQWQYRANPIGGAANDGNMAFTFVHGITSSLLFTAVYRPGAAEDYASIGAGGGILELFGISPSTVNGAATKFLQIHAASVAPSVNPPAGSVFFYLDPADDSLKYRKPSGTVVTI